MGPMARTQRKQKKTKKDRLTPEERAKRVAAHRAQEAEKAAKRKELQAQRDERYKAKTERKTLRDERHRLIDLINHTYTNLPTTREKLLQIVDSAYENEDSALESVSGVRIQVEESCAAHIQKKRQYEEKYADVFADPHYEYVLPWLKPHVFSRMKEAGLLDNAALQDLGDFLGELEEHSADKDRLIRDFKREHKPLFELVPLHRTLTKRLADVSTPYGQWLELGMFQESRIGDSVPAAGENILPLITGTAVELLIRSESKSDDGPLNIFAHARMGAVHNDRKEEEPNWERMILQGSEEKRAEAAVLLGAMECTYRSGQVYSPPAPNPTTVEHLLYMTSTLRNFLDSRGGVSLAGVAFREDAFTPYVGWAEGDFLTPGTLWDCKVAVKKPDGKNLLQVLGYWILGVASGDSTFDEIEWIGIVNPRLGTAWTAHVRNLPRNVILRTADYIIGYALEDSRYERILSRLDSLNTL